MDISSTDDDFVPPVYYPPKLAIYVGSILRAPRLIRHDGNLTHFFSPVRDEQLEYVDGLMVVSSIFLILFVFWAFMLVVLKVKGREVGCASGRAFVTAHWEESSNDDTEGDYADEAISTTSSSSESYSSKPLVSDQHAEHRDISRATKKSSRTKDTMMVLRQNSTDPIEGDRSLDRSPSNCSDMVWEGSANVAVEDNDDNDQNGPLHPIIFNPLERRTRICFLLSASIALIMVPFILVFSFGSLTDAMQSSDTLILSIREVMTEVQASLNSIEESSINAMDLLNNTPTELEVICPKVDPALFQAEFGIDLTEIIGSVAGQYDQLRAEVATQLDFGNSIVDRVESSLASLESSIATSENYMWVIPGLLFAVSVLSALSIVGVVLAWRDKSGIRFQSFMSWGVLPLLIIVATSCWVVVLMASLGSMVGTDICISSPTNGSPDQTVREILSLQGFGNNDTIFQITTAYTNQCTGPDPTQRLQDLENDVQGHLDTIWRQMSKIDSIGRADVIDRCGDEENFTAMLTAARNLAKILTAVRRSISDIRESLRCSVINPIYVLASHEVLCTESLNAAVYGFIMFLLVAICTMVMITLRASWLKHIPEEKIYHDEDEVAENMILDEHEEYLAYISRYKHEWQEYGGFENDSPVDHSDDDYADDEEGSAEDESIYSNDEMRPGNNCSYDGSEERSNVSEFEVNSLSGVKNPGLCRKNTINHISDANTSFLPLSGQGTDDYDDDYVNGSKKLMPSALLPPQRNPDYVAEKEQFFANFSEISNRNSDVSNDTSSSPQLVVGSVSLPHKTTEPMSNVAGRKPIENNESNLGSQSADFFSLHSDFEPAGSDIFESEEDFHVCSEDQSTDEVEVRLSDRPTRQDPPSS